MKGSEYLSWGCRKAISGIVVLETALELQLIADELLLESE
jgi:hypothetical protein